MPVVSGYDIAGVQLVLVYDYRRAATAVLGGRVAAAEAGRLAPLEYLARVVPLWALPHEIVPELERQLRGESEGFPQVVYSAQLFGVLAARLALDLLAGRPVRKRIVVDVHHLPRPAAARGRAPVARVAALWRIRRTARAFRARIGGREPGGDVPMIATTALPQAPVDDPDVARYVRQLVQEGARVRVPGLFAGTRRGAVHRLAERQGISVTALPTSELRRGELTDLLRFRLAQYLDVGFIDPVMVYQARMRHEPLSAASPGDIHLVAGLRDTGEVMAYSVIEASPPAARGTRMRSADRPPFPVEQVHGHGIYNRLPILPDLPVDRVRELGRFVKNHRRDAPREPVLRAVVEIGVAMFRVVTGPLATAVDAFIGDLEEVVARQNLDFFHVPLVVIHGTVPYESATSYLHPRYERSTVYPFACLTSDAATARPRLDAIERALARPGKLGMLSLLGLKGSRCQAPCMLEPAGGPAVLAGLRCDRRPPTCRRVPSCWALGRDSARPSRSAACPRRRPRSSPR